MGSDVGRGALKGNYNDHALLSHLPSLLAAPYSAASASFTFPFRVPSLYPSRLCPPPLLLLAFVLSVCHGTE